jgi:superoxide dismutase, Cu-Zn family
MKQHLTTTPVVVFTICSVAAAPQTASRGVAPPSAAAALIDPSGRGIGQARFQDTAQGVLMMLELKNATPGVHAMHIHEVGRCEAPAFSSAGEHFTPERRLHGFLNARGPHAGDLPNIYVPASTELSLEYLMPNVTLKAGPSSLLDTDGSALVLHAGKDDHTTDPAGGAGDRLACGVIKAENPGR